MATPPDPQRELDQTVRQARLVAFTCCFLAPIMYTYSFGTSVLHGRWQLFFAGFAGLPWADPRVPGSLAAAAVAMTLALLLPPRLGRLDGGSALNTLRLRNLLCCALLVAVAVSGLFLGVKIGPPAASASLILFLAPMVRGLLDFPSQARWRKVIGS
jgi:hypothetical protein